MLDLDKVRWVPYKRQHTHEKDKFIVELIEKDMYFFCKKYEYEDNIITSNQLLIDKIPPKDNCIYSIETDSWHPAFGVNKDGTMNLNPKKLIDLEKVFWKSEDYPPSRFHVFDFIKNCWVLPSESFFSSKKELNNRLEICKTCNHYSKAKVCMKCGCYIPVKSRIRRFSCPMEKW